MANSKASNRVQELTSASVDGVGLPPPIFLEGEDQALYARLLNKVTAAVAPRDTIEEFWTHDVVYLMWEILRLRRWKASLCSVNAYYGLKKVLNSLVEYSEARELASAWHARDAEARETVAQVLEQADLTMDAVMAETLSLKLDPIERIDRMIATAEARRASVLREIDRRRAAFAASLREAAQAIEDAEFTEVSRTLSSQVKAIRSSGVSGRRGSFRWRDMGHLGARGSPRRYTRPHTK
jgi:hypothetical protein